MGELFLPLCLALSLRTEGCCKSLPPLIHWMTLPIRPSVRPTIRVLLLLPMRYSPVISGVNIQTQVPMCSFSKSPSKGPSTGFPAPSPTAHHHHCRLFQTPPCQTYRAFQRDRQVGSWPPTHPLITLDHLLHPGLGQALSPLVLEPCHPLEQGAVKTEIGILEQLLLQEG